MTWRMLDLFSGLAGFTLAAHEVWGHDLETVSFVEIDKRCREFLSRAWPGVPIHEDIKTLDAKQWCGTIDLLTGGVPCQPASRAGKQRGKEDDRWLWDQALRVCEECLPTWALFENPPGIGDVGLDGILSALEGIGYEVQTVDIPACAVGAPHLRHRYGIICHKNQVGLADLYSEGCEERGVQQGVHGCQDAGEQRAAHAKDSQSHMGHTDRHVNGCIELRSREGVLQEHTSATGLEERQPNQDGLQDSSKRSLLNHWSSCVWLPCADGKVRRSPSDSQRMAHGLPVELLEILGEEGREGWTPEDCEPHRSLLAALGNSIVPQVAIEIMKAIKEASR